MVEIREEFNMKDSNRIDILLERIKKIWKKYPDLRFGQFLCNCNNYTVLYYVEDDQLIKILENFYKTDTKDVSLSSPVKEELTESENVILQNTVKSPNKNRIYVRLNDTLKAIFPEELDNYLSKGWKKGRKK